MSFTPSITNFYSITNNCTGSNDLLGFYNSTKYDMLLTVATGNKDNSTALSTWYFYSSGQDKYHICANFTVPSTPLCLGIINPGAPANNNVSNLVIPHLTTLQDDKDQWWTLTPWNDSLNSVKLTNDYSGPALALDIYSDTQQAYMGSGDYLSQYWILNKGEECDGGLACLGDVPGATTAAVMHSSSGSSRRRRTRGLGAGFLVVSLAMVIMA